MFDFIIDLLFPTYCYGHRVSGYSEDDVIDKYRLEYGFGNVIENIDVVNKRRVEVSELIENALLCNEYINMLEFELHDIKKENFIDTFYYDCEFKRERIKMTKEKIEYEKKRVIDYVIYNYYCGLFGGIYV